MTTIDRTRVTSLHVTGSKTTNQLFTKAACRRVVQNDAFGIVTLGASKAN